MTAAHTATNARTRVDPHAPGIGVQDVVRAYSENTISSGNGVVIKAG